MRVNLATALTSGSTAVPSFTCYNLEQAAGVVQAAQIRDHAVCLLLAPAAFASSTGDLLLRCLVSAAESADVPVAVQLDHSSDLKLMRRALELGASAVMADGSTYDFDSNVELVRSAAELARPYGASVEAELGHVPGDEDRSMGVAAGELTEPRNASRFVALCEPDLLAVAVGNVHGAYALPPLIHIDRLQEIAAVVSVPLSLHGTSGLAPEQTLSAIRSGVRKFNVNTELRRIYRDSAMREFGDQYTNADLLGPMGVIVQDTAAAAGLFIDLTTAALPQDQSS